MKALMSGSLQGYQRSSPRLSHDAHLSGEKAASRFGTNLHIVRNEVVYDSRVLRETEALYESKLFASVVIAGFEKTGHPERQDLNGRKLWRIGIRSRFLPKDLLSQSIKYAEWKWCAVRAFRKLPLAVIHCHDLEPLPIAVKLKRATGAFLVYDAHELETERTSLGRVRRRIMQATESRLMKYVDAMVTVSPSIQSWYRTRYQDVPVSLVRNIPTVAAQESAPEGLRAKLKVPNSELLFIFSGGLGLGRSIELLLNAFSSPRLRHHVLFMGEGAFSPEIRQVAQHCENVHWCPPVRPDHVLPMLSQADVGLSLIEDISLSYRYCLPNKLFEYWQAGLPVLASDLPDQACLVDQYNAGWLVNPCQDEITKRLLSITREDLDSVRPGVARIARELTWEKEARVLLSTYTDTLRAGRKARKSKGNND